MWIVRLALRRPYTFVVLAMLILLSSAVTLAQMPTDMYPEINIPVIAAIWNYTGLPPEEMEGRITSQFERAATTTVSGIEHHQDLPATWNVGGQRPLASGSHRRADLAFDAAGRDATPRHALQRIGRSHPPAGSLQRDPDRAANLRPRNEFLALGTRDGAGGDVAPALRGQAERSRRGLGRREALRLGPLTSRRVERGGHAESHASERHREDRTPGVSDPRQRKPGARRPVQRPACQAGQGHVDLPA